ncbi:TetR family transcriptional regulator [Gluconacetobacter sp. 1b LMG 1731]|uniref:TetR family transcriptional regulator n=1 Tax=Gluconacetobacter dulcium TaxID=2729096 RepID=A0A7W4IP70_9PROT|nr:TetR family transcriptional regulator [Gluconacetobacter dulcium]MBB2166428.1 TetR family transcriptional regulator [Gluconacetobacter dulcium]MBB2195564.1 TetR family transcriptional regulator [Gluconacetobacter dulcium]
MTDRRKAQISSRKQPRQTRSMELVASVMEAAVQVLAAEGAQRFTMARVAERAGVSVGSLYQYFPNKAAILFRLQSDEWARTAEILRGILEQRVTPPLDRLRMAVHAFIRSECEETGVRMALDDAAPLYRGAPEAHDALKAGAAIMQAFMREVLPDASADQRALAGGLVELTIRSVGKSYSETPCTPIEIEAFAEAMADMLCAYLEGLNHVA